MRLIPFFAVLLLPGCAALTNAGHADYALEPIITDNGAVCCKVQIKNGKEYATLKAHVERRADGSYVVDLDETAVAAFKGQESSASTAKAGIDAIGNVISNGVKVLP